MSKGKVLYVEDYPVVQIMYTDALKAKGFTVDSVGDGKAAMAKLADNHYDIILLDLLLPQVTGVEFLREYTKLHSASHVVVLTDFDNPETVKEVQAMGVKNYWIKVENTPHDLAERLEKLLGGKAETADK